MTGTVITLIVIGLIFIFASFFISEAVSDSLGETEEGEYALPEVSLSDEQREKLRGDVMKEVESYCHDIVYQAGEQLSTVSNEKMMAIGDYSVSVYEEIEKTHKEVMFLYSMLGDKEKELKMLVEQVDSLKQEIHAAAGDAKQKIEDVLKEVEDTKSDMNLFVDTMQHTDTPEEAPKQPEPVSEQTDSDNANEIILELKKSGMSIIEIAKQLGLGVGEVKLVVDLYENNK